MTHSRGISPHSGSGTTPGRIGLFIQFSFLSYHCFPNVQGSAGKKLDFFCCFLLMRTFQPYRTGNHDHMKLERVFSHIVITTG